MFTMICLGVVLFCGLILLGGILTTAFTFLVWMLGEKVAWKKWWLMWVWIIWSIYGLICLAGHLKGLYEL